MIGTTSLAMGLSLRSLRGGTPHEEEAFWKYAFGNFSGAHARLVAD